MITTTFIILFPRVSLTATALMTPSLVDVLQMQCFLYSPLHVCTPCTAFRVLLQTDL